MTQDTIQDEVKALIFDVFGTVVDWRSSITREGRALGERKGITGVDWEQFADDWRGQYGPFMNKVRAGDLPWTRLDDLHRMSLELMLEKYGIYGLSEAEKVDFNKAWHRLDGWPDSSSGLTRLKTKYIIATMSNGNVALMTNMAKWAGLPWDCILGAELARHYKPDPESYLTAVDLLCLEPSQVMMSAAHKNDLKAAGALGLKTAFIPRPGERGPGVEIDATPEDWIDVVATDFNDLAAQMGT